ncbi:hypothetical protein GGX14DRAFT_408203 [Mycena pura]|uniref:Uncharacterized protein n=1 Tax=Mycena pura TaxID=153505 RepID=A0AAD6XZT0_9AGAR|nr:hypothetical protein GGX14DRAFT_408203 [Mycena pura]
MGSPATRHGVDVYAARAIEKFQQRLDRNRQETTSVRRLRIMKAVLVHVVGTQLGYCSVPGPRCTVSAEGHWLIATAYTMGGGAGRGCCTRKANGASSADTEESQSIPSIQYSVVSTTQYGSKKWRRRLAGSEECPRMSSSAEATSSQQQPLSAPLSTQWHDPGAAATIQAPPRRSRRRDDFGAGLDNAYHFPPKPHEKASRTIKIDVGS